MLLSTALALAAADFDCNYVSDGAKSAPKMRFAVIFAFEMRFLGNLAFFCGAKRDKRRDHRLHRPRFVAFYRVLLSKYRLTCGWWGLARDKSLWFVWVAALLGGKGVLVMTLMGVCAPAKYSVAGLPNIAFSPLGDSF